MKVIVNILNILSLIVIMSCSGAALQNERMMSQTTPYISSGVERFYLSQRSDWSAFSEIASCHQPPIQFLNYDLMNKNYQFHYQQLAFFQNLFETQKNKRGYKKQALTKSEENKIFYEVYQQIDSGATPFAPIKSKKIYAFVIDSIVKSEAVMLKAYLETQILPQAPVVLISRCLSSEQLAKWRDQNHFYNRIDVLGLDFFSVFDSELKSQFYFGLDLSKIFEGIDVTLVTREIIETQHITGYKKKYLWNY